MIGGMNSRFEGGNFWKGFAVGAVKGAVTAGLSYGLSQATIAIGGQFGHGVVGSFGNEMLRAGAHGMANGLYSAATGGDFSQGFATGALASLAGTALHGASDDMIRLGSGLAGAAGSALFGGDPMGGFFQGFNVGALNATYYDSKTKSFMLDQVTIMPRSIVPKSYYFPLPFFVNSFTKYPGRFGDSRRGKRGSRSHAGCDLYAPIGTPVHAITGGRICNISNTFYKGSGAIAIDHGAFIARYCEITPSCNLSIGSVVTTNQEIGTIADIRQRQTMLHFELYKGDVRGALSNDQAPFYRRSDLMNPTDFLLNLR